MKSTPQKNIFFLYYKNFKYSFSTPPLRFYYVTLFTYNVELNSLLSATLDYHCNMGFVSFFIQSFLGLNTLQWSLNLWSSSFYTLLFKSHLPWKKVFNCLIGYIRIESHSFLQNKDRTGIFAWTSINYIWTSINYIWTSINYIWTFTIFISFKVFQMLLLFFLRMLVVNALLQ